MAESDKPDIYRRNLRKGSSPTRKEFNVLAKAQIWTMTYAKSVIRVLTPVIIFEALTLGDEVHQIADVLGPQDAI